MGKNLCDFKLDFEKNAILLANPITASLPLSIIFDVKTEDEEGLEK